MTIWRFTPLVYLGCAIALFVAGVLMANDSTTVRQWGVGLILVTVLAAGFRYAVDLVNTLRSEDDDD